MSTVPGDIALPPDLRYVDDSMPGISRRKLRGRFCYFDSQGQRIRDKQEVARIDALAIPPAYTEVWICPLANGHLQATGRDARGRKQYRYHARWREIRDADKYASCWHSARLCRRCVRRYSSTSICANTAARKCWQP
jgi:DNA topoisomerase-1